jgi:hypothetical protein
MEEAVQAMTGSATLWAYLLVLLIFFYAFIGWWSSREASRAMPAPDVRVRPTVEQIDAAARLLDIQFPASNSDIRKARHAMLPRALGDTFASGQLKADLMSDVMAAADILEKANAFDENPPFEAKYLLAYWEHRAGILGRLWGRHFPPAIVRRLRMQTMSEA